MSTTVWLLVGLAVLVLFGDRLLGAVGGLLRVLWPVAMVLLVIWLITSGQAGQVLDYLEGVAS